MTETKVKISDDVEDWIRIYGESGEAGLMEFSKAVHNPERGIGRTIEKAFIFRLAGVATEYPFSEEEFYRVASKLPPNLTRFIIINRACPETLIEDLWIGNYVNKFGEPFPEMVISQAFYSNHFKMTAIYARRPDLRKFVPNYMQEMVESSLKKDRSAFQKAS